MSGAYLSPGNLPNGDITAANRGRYHEDQIVNITGQVSYVVTPEYTQSSQYSLELAYNGKNLSIDERIKYENYRLMKLNFYASKSPGVNVGDRVMPRTIFHNLFVVVSNRWNE